MTNYWLIQRPLISLSLGVFFCIAVACGSASVLDFFSVAGCSFRIWEPYITSSSPVLCLDFFLVFFLAQKQITTIDHRLFPNVPTHQPLPPNTLLLLSSPSISLPLPVPLSPYLATASAAVTAPARAPDLILNVIDINLYTSAVTPIRLYPSFPPDGFRFTTPAPSKFSLATSNKPKLNTNSTPSLLCSSQYPIISGIEPAALLVTFAGL